MSKIFTRTFRVRWSETDAQGHVDITNYMRYLVETAWDWGAAGGLTLDRSHALGIVWVMRETQFEFFSPLRFNDRFEFTIWMLKWRRVRGTRAFEIRLPDGGQVVAQGAQQVVVLDSQTMRPTSLPGHLLEFYVLEEPRVVPIEPFPKLEPAPGTAFVMERRVEGRDVDQVGIIDNTVFGAYAEEAAARALAAVGWSPAELEARALLVQPRRFHILHQTPAVWGERLRLSVYLRALEDTGGEWVIAVERTGAAAAIATCTLRWTLAGAAAAKRDGCPTLWGQRWGSWLRSRADSTGPARTIWARSRVTTQRGSKQVRR